MHNRTIQCSTWIRCVCVCQTCNKILLFFRSIDSLILLYLILVLQFNCFASCGDKNAFRIYINFNAVFLAKLTVIHFLYFSNVCWFQRATGMETNEENKKKIKPNQTQHSFSFAFAFFILPHRTKLHNAERFLVLGVRILDVFVLRLFLFRKTSAGIWFFFFCFVPLLFTSCHYSHKSTV